MTASDMNKRKRISVRSIMNTGFRATLDKAVSGLGIKDAFIVVELSAMCEGFKEV